MRERVKLFWNSSSEKIARPPTPEESKKKEGIEPCLSPETKYSLEIKSISLLSNANY